MSNQSEEGLKNAYSLMEQGKAKAAKDILAELYQYELGNSEVNFAVWCCSYWSDYILSLPQMDPFEQGEGLCYRWKSFEDELSRKKDVFSKAVYSMQTGVFSLALKIFSSLDSPHNTVQKAEIALKTGICSKKLGKYDEALACLTEANSLSPSSAPVLAEMADCYALSGLEKQAKVLFREAFFIDAQKIDLTLLDSELIRCLIEQVRERGYTGAELGEWVPVYGVLYGVFNVKRELRSQEVGELKQHIFEKEIEIKNPSNNSRLLTPRLINMYFWLMDHYVQKNDSGSRINDILLKIKILDRDVYDLYVK